MIRYAPALLLLAALLLAGCGPGVSADAVQVTDGEVHITGVDMAFDPDEIVVPADTPVRVVLDNPDAVDHDIDITTDDVMFHLHAHPGETVSWEVTLPAGRYEFICTVPGHAAAGMVGVIVAR